MRIVFRILYRSHMIIKKIILITGKQKSGKSNSIGMVYEKLLKIQPKHRFNREDGFFTKSLIKIPLENDFFCIFEPINGIKVGLILSGDCLSDFKEAFDYIKDDIDVLVCASRLIDNENSVFRYITEDIHKYGFEVYLNMGTFPTHGDKRRMADMENTIADTVFSVLEKKFFNH